MFDEKKFDEVVEFIETHPQRWDQSVWLQERDWMIDDMDPEQNMCGTVGCVAGWACLLNGWRMAKRSTLGGQVVVEKDGYQECVKVAGRRELGLESWQADVLFHGNNDLESIKLIGKAIAAGETNLAQYMNGG